MACACIDFGLTSNLLVLAVVGPPWVVAALGDPSVVAGEDEPVGAVVEFWLAVDALPVAVAVLRVGHHSALRLARVLLVFALRLAAYWNMGHKMAGW